jgi:hypothetical protein
MFFQWRINGFDLPSRTNATLTLADIEADDAGAYTLVVNNAAGSVTSLVATLTVRLDGPALVNGGFERDATPPFPGYGTIKGWTPGGAIENGYGLNEANGAFADNGAIPQGTRVCFIQNHGTLSQIVSGFVVGETYWLTYRENARANCCGERVATLSVLADDTIVVPEHAVAIVGGLNPYRLVTSKSFVASAASMAITIAKGGTGDATALIDDIRILTRNAVRLGIIWPIGSAPTIHLEGIPNRPMTVEYTESLTPGTPWQLLTNLTLGAESEVIVDNTPVAAEARFYRAGLSP